MRRTHQAPRGSVLRALAWGASLALAACGPSRAEPQPAQPDAGRVLIPQDAPRDAAVRTEDLAPLPEDEAAGKRSEAQWREHLEEEEEERHMAFDQPRLPQHRALVRLIEEARRACDRARSEQALAGMRKQMPRRVAVLRARLNQLDPWGVNSRLLGDYAQLFALLEQSYPEAMGKALRGDPVELAEVRGRFDAHMARVEAWLEELEREGAGEHEHEHEHEHERGALDAGLR